MNFFKYLSNQTRLLSLTIIVLLLFFQSASVFAATLTSTVNRNSMSTNETLTLTVTLDEQAKSSALNIDGLKQDFEILGILPRNSSSISTVNGKTSRIATTQWTITLAAKREGNLSIPALTIKQASSKPINIKALSAAQLTSGANTQSAPLSAMGLAEKASIYPGQQLIYRIELSAAANVSDLNGSALEIAGASAELVGQQQYQRVDNGIARTVVILTYAIFAQNSGSITIPSITFTGLVGGRRSIFGNQGQQVVGRTNALDIEVKAKPASNNGASWFPAAAVDIRSSWSGDPNSIQTGSPITRTITVTAEGQQATAIAPLKQTALTQASVKSYKDKPQLDTRKTSTGFSATRIESEAIVVNQSGKVELPAIIVDWFNVNKGQWEQVTLPAETLTVSGQAVTRSAPILTPTNPEVAPVTLQNSLVKTHWAWPVATGFLALICLIQAFLLIRRKPNNEPLKDQSEQPESEANRWKDVIKDLNKDDPKAVRSSIIQWLRAANPTLSNVSLNTLSENSNTELGDSIKKLEASLFSNGDSIKFDDYKAELKQQLEAYRQQLRKANSTKKKQTPNELEPLYLK